MTTDVLILEHGAAHFAEALGEAGLSCHCCESVADLDHDYDVLLAAPDLAADYLRQGRSCRWIQSTWAGVQPLIEVLRATDQPPIVTGVKGIFGPLIAEYIFAYLLRIVRKSDLFESQQSARTWRPAWPGTLQGKSMTAIGTGSIGSHVAGVAKAFGMSVTGVSRSGTATDHFDAIHTVAQLHQAIRAADVVVAILPDTPATRLMVDEGALRSMRDDSIFINVGRGATVDESALAAVLREQPNRQALLDVFTIEPLPVASELWELPNVTVTPHISAVSYPEDVAQVFLANLACYREGAPLQHVIDVAKGY